VILIDFPNFIFLFAFSPDFHRSQFFQGHFRGVFWAFFHAKTGQNTPKTPPGDPAGWINTFFSMQRTADFSKNVFVVVEWGEIQNSARTWKRGLNHPVETNKNHIQCENAPTEIPNFEWRTAAAEPLHYSD